MFSVISALIPNLLLLLLVLRVISRPIQRVTLAAIEVANGGYGTEVDLRQSNDEIGLLAESFNEMSRKMASDIEQLRLMNEQLIKTEKLAAMGTLAAGVSHEVNNPLASISSIVQSMRDQEGHSPETRENLGLISDQIQRISQVTKDMTNFARSGPSERVVCSIDQVLKTALRLSGFDTRFKKLSVISEFKSRAKLYADRDQLQQVFLNLFLNARDAMPRGGTLTVRTYEADQEVIIEIEDTGSGISEADIAMIFDPFFTTKKAGQGTGLGLPVCYGIINAHGGRIEAKNNGQTGATFTVVLPIFEG